MRNLLAGLRPIDQFDILSFSGGSERFAASSLRADAANLRRATDFMERMNAGGGTELLPSLKRALALPRADASRIVVVITDGFVAVEKEAFELVRRSLGEANLFAFGIGSSVNRFLVEGLARAGRGDSFVVDKPKAAPVSAARFRSYVSSPVLRNIRVQFAGFAANDVTPAAPPDLFAERPLTMFGRYHGDAKGRIVVAGSVAGGRFEQTIDLANAVHLDDGAALRWLWARDRL